MILILKKLVFNILYITLSVKNIHVADNRSFACNIYSICYQLDFNKVDYSLKDVIDDLTVIM